MSFNACPNCGEVYSYDDRRAQSCGVCGHQVHAESELHYPDHGVTTEPPMIVKPKKLTAPQHRQHYAEAKAKMVRKLLALGYDMNWGMAINPSHQFMKKWEVCSERINAWIMERGCVRKEIKFMTYEELKKTITQFQHVVNSFKKKI